MCIKYIEWNVTSWPDAMEIASHMTAWLFRGQQEKDWLLIPSLERISQHYDYPIIGLREAEREILSKFKRHAHQYLDHLPNDAENIEWLSIIQHHGGPTRFLDFTESFYIASFFALENAFDSSAAVWAINHSTVNKQHKENISCDKSTEDLARDIVESNILTINPLEIKENGVISVRPWRLNQRMIVQKGWFLSPLGCDLTFELNLNSILEVVGEKLPSVTPIEDIHDVIEWLHSSESPLLFKFIFKSDQQCSILSFLEKININASKLFPGLDGFARSLQFSLKAFKDLEWLSDNDVESQLN